MEETSDSSGSLSQPIPRLLSLKHGQCQQRTREKRVARLGKKRESQRKCEIVYEQKCHMRIFIPICQTTGIMRFRELFVIVLWVKISPFKAHRQGKDREFKRMFFFGRQAGPALPQTLVVQIISRRRVCASSSGPRSALANGNVLYPASFHCWALTHLFKFYFFARAQM